MRIINIRDVITLNELLAAQDVPATVHLHDACGGQTLSLEVADGPGDGPAAAHRVVLGYFDQRGIPIEFDQVDGHTFWAVRTS